MGAQEYEEFRWYLAAAKEYREARAADLAASAAFRATTQRRQAAFEEMDRARLALTIAVEGER